MKTDAFFATTACPKTLAGRLRTACATRLLPLLLLLTLPAVLHAQDFTYTTNNGAITITKYTGSGGAVVIPSTINGLPVASIGNLAFRQCTSLTNVAIPDGVTSIDSCVLCGWPSALLGMNPNPHEKLRAEFCDLFPPPGQSFDCIMSP